MSEAIRPLPQPDGLSEGLFHIRRQSLIGAILDNLSEGVIIADASGQLVYFSQMAQKFFGPPPTQASAEQWSRYEGIFRPDGQTPFPPEELPLRRALKGEETRDVELFVRSPTMPEGLYVRSTGIPLRDAQGQLLGAMALFSNVIEQRQVQAEKRRAEEHFRLLVETAQEGVWTIDADGNTTYVNQYLAQMLGYTVKEMMGRHLLSFMDEEGKRIAQEKMNRRRQGIAEVHDFRLVRRDGRPLWASISTTPIQDEQGRYRGALAMISDVTERRAAEEQVRKLNAELEQRIAQRTAQLEFSNRELEAFAYSVAHDLRAPLRSITSFSEALAEDCAPSLNATGLDYLRRISGGAKRMAELIDGILALSRVNRTELATSRCDLSALARAITDQLQALHPERSARITVQEELVDRGDPQLLRSVLENLLGNAWKFTRERTLSRIEFGAREESGVRTYYVRDNGAGFDMAYQDKLFGVFQRLHTQTEFEGNGVGLATVQRIIRRHGGRIWGEGQPGRGACFYFTLNESPPPPGTAPLSSEK